MRSMMTQWVRPGDGASRARLVSAGVYVMAAYDQNPLTIEEGRLLRQYLRDAVQMPPDWLAAHSELVVEDPQGMPDRTDVLRLLEVFRRQYPMIRVKSSA